MDEIMWIMLTDEEWKTSKLVRDYFGYYVELYDSYIDMVIGEFGFESEQYCRWAKIRKVEN